MTISRELLDELLSGVERPEDFLGEKGLMKELKVRLMERMLGAELTEHLSFMWTQQLILPLKVEAKFRIGFRVLLITHLSHLHHGINKIN